MNILVLGASGGCGRWVCRLAAERGHTVKAVVREGSQAPRVSGVHEVVADVLDDSIWPDLLENQDAVISALGIKRSNPRNPFSRLVSPEGLTTSVTKAIVRNAPSSLKRIAAVSAAGVRDSYQSTAGPIRWMISKSNMKPSYDDLESMEGVLADSHLDWMAVRPTTLYERGPTERCKEISSYGLMSRVSRGDVAQWMIHFVEGQSSVSNRTPIIAHVRRA